LNKFVETKIFVGLNSSAGIDGLEDMKRISGIIVAEGKVKPEKGVKVINPFINPPFN